MKTLTGLKTLRFSLVLEHKVLAPEGRELVDACLAIGEKDGGRDAEFNFPYFGMGYDLLAVARDEAGKTVGYGEILVNNLQNALGEVSLNSLFTDPDAGIQDVDARLFDFIVENSKGFKTMYTRVWGGDKKGAEFFKKRGAEYAIDIGSQSRGDFLPEIKLDPALQKTSRILDLFNKFKSIRYEAENIK